MTAPFHELDTVVLLRDLPEAGLRNGDLGAIVHVYGSEALEVEFVTASGRTQALLTLPISDVRPVRDDDLLAVRTSPPDRGANGAAAVDARRRAAHSQRYADTTTNRSR